MRRLVAIAAVGSLALAGCSNAQEAEAGARDLSFAVVLYGDPDSGWWNVVKKGAEDAAAEYGVDVEIIGEGDAAGQAALVDGALASQPDGLVVSMTDPDPLRPSLTKAHEQGVPFITLHGGTEAGFDMGGIGHFGQAESVAGEAVGTKLADMGVKNAICLIHEPGNIALEERCTGIEKTLGGKLTNIQVDYTNPQSVQSTVRSTMLGDPSIDGIAALNADVTMASLEGVKAAGSEAVVSSFDLNDGVVEAIRNGEVAFTVDQQQYLQGYMPIVMLVLYNENLNTLGGGLPVLTGPSFVTQENVDEIAELIAEGTR